MNTAPVVAPSAVPASERRRWAIPAVIGAAVVGIVLSGSTAFLVHSELRRLGGWETDVIRRENEAKTILDQRDQIKRDIETLRGGQATELQTLEKLRADVADLTRLKGERDRAELDAQEARKKLLELETALKSATLQRDEILTAKRRLETDVSDLQTRKAGLEKDNAGLTRDRQKIADDMAKAQDELQRIKQVLEDTSARLRKADADLSRTSDEFVKVRQQALEAEERKFTADLATKAAQQQAASAKEAALAAEARIPDAEKLFRDLDAKARDARKSIDQLHSDESALNGRIGPLQSQVQSLEQSLPPRRDEFKALESGVADLKNQKIGLEADVERLKPVIDQMRADQAKAEVAARARAEGEKSAAAVRADLAHLQDDLAASTARRNDLENIIKRLEDQTTKIKIDDAAAQASEAKRKDAETNLRQIRDEQARAERDLMDAKARVAEMVQRRAILEGELSELIRRREEMRSSPPPQSPVSMPKSEPSNVNGESKP